MWRVYQDYAEHPYTSPERDETVFANLIAQGKEKVVPKRHMVRTSEGLLPGSIILLWRIAFETFTTDSVFPKYLEYTYGISGENELQKLVSNQYAYMQTASDSLVHLSMQELKYLLKQYNVSGYSKMKRGELEQFVRQQLTLEQLEAHVQVRGYRLTEKGQMALTNNQYIVDQHPKKQY